MKDLEKALRGVTRTAQERFRRAFDDINAQFTRIFEMEQAENKSVDASGLLAMEGASRLFQEQLELCLVSFSAKKPLGRSGR